jgi:hypothetical protein
LIRRTAAIVVLLGTAPAAASAQDSVRLRFAPPEGVEVHRLFQRYTRTVMNAPDGTRLTREAAQLGGARQVTLLSVRGRTTLHLSFDSLRVRTREADEPWRESVSGGVDTLWMQVDADERLELRWPEGTPTHPQTELLLRLLTGLPGVVLPERWVRERQQWRAELELGYDEVGIEQSEPSARLRMRAILVVDSIVPRSRDTLAFLGVQGAAIPATVRTREGTRFSYEGSVSGALVWSTGWKAIVSAATRSTVTVEVRRADGAEPAGTLTVETTLRQAVVP